MHEDDGGVLIHRSTISGMWSTGLDIILSDPSNAGGLCNQFEYECRGTIDTNTSSFPISGKYTGWFNMNGEEDGPRNRIPEDVTLKFQPNNKGFWNVEGEGSNMFAKYTITGTLDRERVLTIFRHHLPVKVVPTNNKVIPEVVNKESVVSDEDRMALDDVLVPDEAEQGGRSDRSCSAMLDPLVSLQDHEQYAVSSRRGGSWRVENNGAITVGTRELGLIIILILVLMLGRLLQSVSL